MLRFPDDWILWAALMKPALIPAKEEVAVFTVSCPEMVEEPEMVSLPVTERFAPTVADPPALMFWEVVMNPVLVIPLAVVVP